MALFSCGGLSFWLSAVILQAACVLHVSAAPRRFSISNDLFMKDNEPFIIRSGSLHYFRVPAQYWRDRIQRMKALGLNTVTAYVAWNYHEEVEGQFHDLEMVSTFLDIIHEEGMLVILRPGPYICAEWEFGGLPSYLLGKTGIKIRTYNAPYINAVDRWLNKLYTSIGSKAYSKGGPIIAVQIENEYGYFGDCAHNHNDAMYMYHLHDLAHSYFGPDIVYTTIDGGNRWTLDTTLPKGTPWFKNSSVLATIDGEMMAEFSSSFAKQKEFNAPGHAPKMWSELWTGWFTMWGDAHQANRSALQTKFSNLLFNKIFGEVNFRFNEIMHSQTVMYGSVSYKDGVKEMIDEGASFSLYMAHGGTNFGFWSGAMGDSTANGPSSYQALITSYDYSAPISEAGDHNIGTDGGDLFHAVRKAITSKYGKAPEEPPPIPKVAYGKINFTESASLFANLDKLQTGSHTVDNDMLFPSFEKLSLPFGLMLYRRTPGLEGSSSFSEQNLNFNSFKVHDRVQVFVEGSSYGSVSRVDGDASVRIPAGKNMDLLVENMGRINTGATAMYDYKGLFMKPPVGGNWTAHCLPLSSETVQRLPFSAFTELVDGQPVFRRGALQVHGTPMDTFLDTDGLIKGVIWVNGHNIGRFWPTNGPQRTLYVPAPYLRSGTNDIIVLDLEGSTAGAIESVALSSSTERLSNPIEFVVLVNAALAVCFCLAGCWCRRGCHLYCCRGLARPANLLKHDDVMDCESPKLLLEGDNRYRLMAG